MTLISRRAFMESTAATCAMTAAIQPASAAPFRPGRIKQMDFGLVTYLWGRDWDVKTLIKNCEATNCRGVELRTTHAHGVERSLTKQQRADVKKRFQDSNVTLVGIGSNERYDNPDPKLVRRAIEATKEFIVLCHEVGGTGVKVKPDRLYKNVPRDKTITQIGNALNELGPFAMDHGVELRLEIHGGCAELPTIKSIMDVATHPAVSLCWNSNPQDLAGKGLDHNFALVKDRFGATVHVHDMDEARMYPKGYPYQRLFELFVKMNYDGWILLEAIGKPKDRVAALKEQRQIFDQLVANAKAA